MNIFRIFTLSLAFLLFVSQIKNVAAQTSGIPENIYACNAPEKENDKAFCISPTPETLSTPSSTTRASLASQIRALKRRIKRSKNRIKAIRKHMKESDNLLAIASYQLKLLDYKERLQSLKDKLNKLKNSCPANKSHLKLTFENNSSYTIRVFAYDQFENYYHERTLEPLSIKTFKLKKSTVENYTGSNSFMWLALETTINNQQSLLWIQLFKSEFPSEKPCTKHYTYELYDSSFEVPNALTDWVAYYREDDKTCCTTDGPVYSYRFHLDQEANLPSDAIILQGGFSSISAAESWVCNRPVCSHFWSVNIADINGTRITYLPCDVNTSGAECNSLYY